MTTIKTNTIRILTVTDLHQSRKLYDQLGSAVRHHQPDIVAVLGDFLDMADDRDLPLTKAECALTLAALPCQEVVFVRGNHEGDGWPLFVAAWHSIGKPLRALHAEAFAFGPAVLVGFPCKMGDAFHYLEGRESESNDVQQWFSAIAKAYGSASRFLWLMHEPPTGTGLSAETGAMAGNPEWNHAIELYAPQLVVCGHDHRTPLRRARWHAALQQARCITA